MRSGSGAVWTLTVIPLLTCRSGFVAVPESVVLARCHVFGSDQSSFPCYLALRQMRIIRAQQLEQGTALFDEIIDVLHNDGLVCFPGRRQYSIAASLMSSDAVIALVQSKRRSGKAPSLVLIPDLSHLPSVVDEIPVEAEALARTFWPGPLTIVLRPNSDLPARVRKTIAGKPARIGVRLPDSGFQQELVCRFASPLLVSSANISQRSGAGSASNVRKHFNHTIDLMIDAGDIPDTIPSTVVDLTGTAPVITREGLISAASVQEVLAGASI